MLRNSARSRSESSLLRDVIDAATSLSDRGALCAFPDDAVENPGVLLAFAPYAQTNVFQSLLYKEAWSFGVAPLPIPDLLSLGGLPWPGRMICHFHWLAPLTPHGSKETGRAKVRQFEQMLSRLKEEQRTIVWTVHNVLPHDTPDTDAAIEIREIMTKAADAIHIMNPDTPSATEAFFSLSGKKTFCSPHPSYLGAYPDFTSREEARFQLGIEQRAIVFLCFGAIQPYKGVLEFLEASRQLSARRPDVECRFVIAGPPQNRETLQSLLRESGQRRNVSIHAERVRTEDVQYYFRSADFVVCPYRYSLNSGTAMLSLSFGVPLLAPALGAFPHLVQETTGILYRPDDPDGLVGAMLQAIDDRDRFSATDCRGFAERSRPTVASRQFFEGLLSLTGFGSSPCP